MCQIYAGQDPRRYAATTRRMRINRQSTSIRLENLFWDILDELAESEGLSTAAFVSKLQDEVVQLHGEPVNFSSLLRCTCLVYLDRKQSVVRGPASREPVDITA
ncbi:MAG: ribbon-helix-helix domain-containing protein [Natronohydrobacter sp.]|nr:ribbon-helix-helix domain-containing protein [Natronohydrobacter sp.]